MCKNIHGMWKFFVIIARTQNYPREILKERNRRKFAKQHILIHFSSTGGLTPKSVCGGYLYQLFKRMRKYFQYLLKISIMFYFYLTYLQVK